MRDKKAFRVLQKEFARHDGLYLLEGRSSAALADRYLRSRDGKRFTARVAAALLTNQTEKIPNIWEILQKENSRAPFSEDDFSSLSNAVTLSLIRFVSSADEIEERARRFAFAARMIRALSDLDMIKLYEEFSSLHRELMRLNPHCYKTLDTHSRAVLRRAVIRYAKRKGVSETEGARLYVKEKPKPDTALRQRIALGSFWTISILLCLISFLLCGIAAGLLLVIPVLAFSAYLTQSALLRLFPPIPVYSLKPGPIPENARTLVVITALFSGGEGDAELFARLRKYYYRNKGKNLRFGILADLPESKHADDPKDSEILKNAEKMLETLQNECGDHFCLFVRRRTKSFSEGNYMGWERKRGALLELCRAARGGNHSFTLITESEQSLHLFRYVITLDADTELSIGAAAELVFTMLHPENKPIIQNGIVVSGYGVLQPRMIPSLFSASRTMFSVLQTGSGGRDSYAAAAGDFDQNTFGKSGFCGKGIFDIDAFLATLDGAYPDERILSHDLLESTRLRCGALTAKTFTDAVPAGPLAYYKRQHRWMRGDLQSLPFSFGYHKNAEGKRVKNPIDSASRQMIRRNVLFLLRPIFCFFTLICACFLPAPQAAFAFFFATLHLLFPFIKSLLFTARTAGRRFYSAVLQGIWHALLDALYSLSGLAETALLHLDAFLRSAIRMLFTHKHLLQWVTADHMERGSKNSLTAYITGMWKSILTGLLFLAFAPAGLLTLYGALTLLFPIVSYLIARPFKEKQEINDRQKNELTAYAKDAWGYYAVHVGEDDHYLPPDNYQFSPVPALARRTSPTNIAMYLLSALAATDLAFISPQELYDRLSSTLSTLASLPKYRGHLYNWYSTETLDVIGMPYISTVDSGNFTTALVALRHGIEEYAENEKKLSSLVPIIEKMIAECDFSFLYNKSRHLFCIGYDPVSNLPSDNCYDLYMSESRTTSYYAVAKGLVEKEHWQYLGRPLIKSEGHMGMASWSGTAFEYFMPALFLPTFRNSLAYECLGYALFEQSHDDSHGLWGRSESGYYAFDNDMNYQYKAFGAHTLALDPHSLQNDVLAPYASFLTLPMSVSMPLQNLKNMKKAGMYGPYGFYEAVDYTPTRVGKGHGIVRSYMAHHVGMTILSVANAVKGNLFVQRFMKEPAMEAAEELLTERIPVNAPISRNLHRRPSPPSLHKRVLLPEDFAKQPNTGLPVSAGLFTEGISLLASAAGDVSLMAKNTALTYPLFDEQMPLRGLQFLVKTDHGVLNVLDGMGGKFGRFEDALVYAGKTGGISYHTAFTASGELPLISLQLTLDGEFTKAEPLLFSEVILSKTADWMGHPNYTGLFVQCRHLPEDNALVFMRRPKKENEKPFYFLITMEGGGFDFITRRDEAFGPMYRVHDLPSLFDRSFDNKDGQCILPFFALRRLSECPRGKFVAEFLFGAGEDIDVLLKSIRQLRREKKQSIGEILAESYTARIKNRLIAAGYDGSFVRYEQFILSSLLYDTRKEPERLISTAPDLFWRHGISTDLPMVALVCPEKRLPDNVIRILSGFLRTQKYLGLSGFSFDLLLFYQESEQYACPVRGTLTSLVTQTVGEGMLSRKGGVHLITDPATLAAAEYLCPIYLELDSNTVLEKAINLHFTEHEPKGSPLLIQKPTSSAQEPVRSLLSLSNGAFTENGYRVFKNRCKLPQSRIYCSHQFGTLLTHNSLGVTYFRNASEFSLTRRRPDPLLDLDGERLLLTVGTDIFDLAAAARNVDFSLSCARYEGDAGNIRYELQVGCDDKFPVKLVLLRLTNAGDTAIVPSIEYKIRPALGKSRCIRRKVQGDTVFFRSLDSLCAREEFGIYLTSKNLPSELLPGQTAVCHFLLGVVNYRNDRSFYAVNETFSTSESVETAFVRYGAGYRKLLGKWNLTTDSPALDLMFNEYIPYQTLTSRIFARTGFYQAGGAYGFRDQLQDCVNMLPIDPDLTARQILRSAVRQYAEGDVQHWWHENTDGPHGMRTRCSDDLLWLPYAAAEYVAATGNRDILHYRLPYLSSKPLAERENERYEHPEKTAHRETLLMHCMRALDLALQRKGSHGLPLIGSGDWNDGMNRVGKNGKGESVWLGMFLIWVLERFSAVCIEDPTDRERYLQEAEALRKAVLSSFSTDRFLRGYYDNGKPLGHADNEECRIDILPQAFSAFLFPDDPRVRTAMECAWRELFDRDAGILKLFTPPFDKSQPDPGYIRGYLPGIRENGGQYTHGAMWGALGFFACKMADEGYAVLCGSNPAARCLIPSLAARYRLEPYALAGDIYAGPHAGRGGWSHYTGAAGWFFTVVLKGMLGYCAENGKITLCPNLPCALPFVTLKRAENGKVISRRLERERDNGNVIEIDEYPDPGDKQQLL